MGTVMPAAPDGARQPRRVRRVSPYFGAKIRVRAPSAHLVERPRLTGLLDQLADVPVILVVAPAGSGKTSLAAQWLEHSNDASAWLALDDSDDDLVSFWTGVISALDHALPGCGNEALIRLPRPDGIAEAVHALVTTLS